MRPTPPKFTTSAGKVFRPTSCKFPDTDFAAIARGYGARAATVRTLADLDPVKAWVAEGAPGVFVIDGKINPNLEADWHAEHFPN